MKWFLNQFRQLRKLESVSSWIILLLLSYAVTRLTFLGLSDSRSDLLMITGLGGLVLGLTLQSRLIALIGPATGILISIAEVRPFDSIEMNLGAAAAMIVSVLLPPVVAGLAMKKYYPGEYLEKPAHLMILFAISLSLYIIVSVPLYYFFAADNYPWWQRLLLDCTTSSVNLLLFGPFFAYLIAGHEMYMPAKSLIRYLASVLFVIGADFIVLYPWEYQQIQLLGILLSLPVIMYIAHRFRLFWVLIALISHILTLAVFTKLGYGLFFQEGDLLVRAIGIQSYLAFIIVSIWILALYRRNQETATEALTAMNEHLEDLVNIRTETLEKTNEQLKKENEVRKQLEAVLQRQALKDSITDLPGRDGLRIEYVDWVESEELRDRMLLVSIGIDGFKSVNDALGHSTGDEILRRTAARLSHTLGDRGIVARWAGDEFIIVCDESNSPAIDELLTEVQTPFSIVADTIHLTATGGVTYPRDHSYELEESIRCAALAMQRAKAQEKGHYLFYDAAMEESARHHIQMLAALKDALENGDFRIHYQPILNTKGDNLYGMEALIRWQDKKTGSLIPPGSFIPFAERTGLIVPIGKWMIAEITTQAVQWKKEGLDFGIISINASGRQLDQPDFADAFIDITGKAGLESSLFQIEITESVLLDSQDAINSNINTLTKAGIPIALDDFGTGYSSLAYLERFPVQTVKIDRSFVQSLRSGMNAATVIQAIGFIAEQLNLKVVVEGIENQTELDKVENLILADGWQGFYYSKPLSASDMTEFIRNHQKAPVLPG